MKFKLVDSPTHGRAAKHGFNYAIQITRTSNGWFSTPARDAWRSVIHNCQERLGKPYQIDWQRPGKSRKWFLERRGTFDRFYFKSEAARTLVLMCM